MVTPAPRFHGATAPDEACLVRWDLPAVARGSRFQGASASSRPAGMTAGRPKNEDGAQAEFDRRAD